MKSGLLRSPSIPPPPRCTTRNTKAPKQSSSLRHISSSPVGTDRMFLSKVSGLVSAEEEVGPRVSSGTSEDPMGAYRMQNWPSMVTTRPRLAPSVVCVGAPVPEDTVGTWFHVAPYIRAKPTFKTFLPLPLSLSHQRRSATRHHQKSRMGSCQQSGLRLSTSQILKPGGTRSHSFPAAKASVIHPKKSKCGTREAFACH